MVGVHHNDNENCLPSMSNVSLSDRLYSIQYTYVHYSTVCKGENVHCSIGWAEVCFLENVAKLSFQRR